MSMNRAWRAVSPRGRDPQPAIFPCHIAAGAHRKGWFMIFKATAAKGHRSSNQSHARVGAARDDARTPATGTTRMMARRSLLLGAAGAAIGGPAVVDAQPQPPARAAAPPPFVMRGIPGPGHEVMKVLAGKWRAAVTLYIALGSPTEPVTSRDCVTTREWIGGGRYLYDTTTGTIAGFPFWRVGTLGYSNMDRRFEWVTQDGINSNMMIYLAARNS